MGEVVAIFSVNDIDIFYTTMTPIPNVTPELFKNVFIQNFYNQERHVPGTIPMIDKSHPLIGKVYEAMMMR